MVYEPRLDPYGFLFLVILATFFPSWLCIRRVFLKLKQPRHAYVIGILCSRDESPVVILSLGNKVLNYVDQDLKEIDNF